MDDFLVFTLTCVCYLFLHLFFTGSVPCVAAAKLDGAIVSMLHVHMADITLDGQYAVFHGYPGMIILITRKVFIKAKVLHIITTNYNVFINTSFSSIVFIGTRFLYNLFVKSLIPIFYPNNAAVSLLDKEVVTNNVHHEVFINVVFLYFTVVAVGIFLFSTSPIIIYFISKIIGCFGRDTIFRLSGCNGRDLAVSFSKPSHFTAPEYAAFCNIGHFILADTFDRINLPRTFCLGQFLLNSFLHDDCSLSLSGNCNVTRKPS